MVFIFTRRMVEQKDFRAFLKQAIPFLRSQPGRPAGNDLSCLDTVKILQIAGQYNWGLAYVDELDQFLEDVSMLSGTAPLAARIGRVMQRRVEAVRDYFRRRSIRSVSDINYQI
jgi:hypothetical protein